MGKFLALFFLFISFFFHSHPAAGQEYRAFALRYSMEDGLPNRLVRNVIQDRRGFIWAATDGGVVRFDGQRFKIFNQADNGLSSDIVGAVAEDANGNIWAIAAHLNAIDIINPVSGKVTSSNIFLKDQPFPVPFNRLCAPPERRTDGALVFQLTNPSGCLVYHPGTGSKIIEIPDCDAFYLLKASEKHTFWGIFIGRGPNNGGVVEIDENANVLQRFPAKNAYLFSKSLSASGLGNSFYVTESPPVISGKQTIWKFTTDGSKVGVCDYSKSHITRQFFQTEKDQIYVELPKIFDRSGQCILDISKQFPELDGAQIFWSFVDKSGKIWLATGFGLVVVELRKDYFKRLLYNEKVPGGRGYACRGIIEKNGLLTVNTENTPKSRFLIDLKTGMETQLPGLNSFGIAASGDGNIWTDFGKTIDNYWYTSVVKTSPDGKLLGPALFKKQWNGLAVAILEESPARVLLGGDGWSVIAFNPLTGGYSHLSDPACPEFAEAHVSSIRKERSGNIGICTSEGYYRLKPDGHIERYWTGGKGAFHLPYDNLIDFYEDNDGVCWVGTGGAGLMRWTPGEKGNATLLFRKNGLLNGKIYAVYEDKHKHLWLPSDYGIVQFDKENLQMRHTWLTSDGVTHNEFNRTSHCQGADGSLYFGGLNGITVFNPDEFYATDSNESVKPVLTISDFSVFDGSSGQLENRAADLLQNNHITVHPGDRYIQLEFALLEYFSPEKVSYSWKFDGLTDGWAPLNEPVLRLSSLPLGLHHLQIRAQAADGTWAENELNIQVEVLAPVYLRWWFLLIVACLLALAVWGWSKWRTAELLKNQQFLETEIDRQTTTIRRQTESLRALDEAKNRFFANVSHELRTPLTLMLGPLDSMLKRKRLEPQDQHYAQTAHTHSKELLQLVNEILDLSKLESGKMKLQEMAVSLQPYLRRVVSAFESHAERLGIQLVFEYKAHERLRVLVDNDKLQKVLNNLISNALKFTPPHAQGMVNVRVEDLDGQIRIEVQDNGRGIHADDLPHIFDRFYQTAQMNAPIEGGTGIGLALSREIAALFDGTVWVESTLGIGSRFYFQFPKKEVLGVGNERVMIGEMINNAESLSVLKSVIPPAEQVDSVEKQDVILLVEDNDSLRDYLRMMLSGRYEILEAENGGYAMSLLETRLPDLIISDIMMPVMDGFQLLEQIKNQARFQQIPIIMLTARADLHDKLRALRIGVDDYLLKPFEEAELLARVENLLHNARLRKVEQLGVEIEAMPESEPDIAPTETLSPKDREWFEQLEKMVLASVGDSRLSPDWLAQNLFVGRNVFYKKVKLLTGMTPNDYIQTLRFAQARRLLETRQVETVKEAAYAVGVKDVKYFSEVFRRHFGKLPSEYLNR